MTISGVVKCLPELIEIAKAKTIKEQREIIARSPNCIIYAISEICLNILNGNIPLTPSEKRKLIKYKNHIRLLANKKETVKTRKVVVNQVGGALSGLLIPAISLLSRFIYNKL